MRTGIVATAVYGAVILLAIIVLMAMGISRSAEGPQTAIELVGAAGAALAGALLPVALAWLVVLVRLLQEQRVATPQAEEGEAAAPGPALSADAVRVEDRRDFFNNLDRYRTAIYNQFIEVFQDTGLIDAYRAFKFPDNLPMVDRPCIFLVEHLLALEKRGEPVPERFNLDNEELRILLRQFDEMVGHAKRTSSTFVLRRNDMRVYQMLGGEFP